MSRYSKAIAAIIGGVLSVAAGFGLPTEWATPPVQMALASIISGALVWAAPANT